MGRVAAPFGIKGWVKIQPFTQDLAALGTYPQWWVGSPAGWARTDVEQVAEHGALLVAKLAGIDTPEAAAGLRGREVAVPRAALPAPAEGEFYWVDLVGLEVRNLADEVLGRVVSVTDNGAQSVLVVRGEREHLIPFVDHFVRQVDMPGGRIVADWGLDY